MLKYTHDAEKGEQTLEIKGNLLELLAECTYMVKTIYEQLKEKNPDWAEGFKKQMIKCIGDEESPVWVDKSLRDRLIGKLDKLLDILKGVKESEE